MSPAQLATLVLLIPLASAVLIAFCLRRHGALAALVSVLAAGALAVLSLVLIFGGHRFTASMEWLRFGSYTIDMGFKFNDLAALMLFVVSVVGFFIHLFSLGYMRDDPGRARYFGGLSVFMFSMLGIVFADNLLMIFVFWELVGFSSYLLIGHYYEKQSAADAAIKAFVVNRVGDWGFLAGIIGCYWAFGTVNLSVLETQVAGGAAVAGFIPLLLFCGAVGKSAQMPLHVWLPDAMEGPTPVSALIHAATMVAAGVYMLCRVWFLMVPDVLTLIAWVGTVTALYAAFCAVTQRDIKKVLAYSTLSQLGYMIAAFGLGSLAEPHGGATMAVAAGVGAAMFHLTTHAFFKALLFLGAGSIILACHHEQDIFKMGGLAKKMPVTFATFTIAVLAIIGCPFFAGFFSKDAILYLAFEKNHAIFVILAAAAILTALYMTRLWRITFFGAPRSEAAEHAHENGLVMLIPLLVLAAGSALGGYLKLWPAAFAGVADLVPEAAGAAHAVIFGVSLTVLLTGVIVALVLYRPAATDALEAKAPGLYGFLAAKLWIDEFYDWYVAKVQQRFAMLLNFLEQVFLAGLIVRGLAGLVGLVGLGARALYVGRISGYVYWFLIGVIVFWGFAAGWF